MNKLFESFAIDSCLIKALGEQGIDEPTPVQQEVIPPLIDGRDVVAQAPTGTGKTLAFVLPALMRVNRNDPHVQTLILCPTRELVIQIVEVIQSCTKYFEGLRAAGIYGGQNIQRQLLLLRKKPQIAVGTPGRALDHIARRTLRLDRVGLLVLDEGDEMLDMGFRGDIEKIIAECPAECQKAVFSATLPKAVAELVERKTKDPVFVKTTKDGDDTPAIDQYFCMVKDAQRVGVTIDLIEGKNYRRVIVFCNTKLRAQRLGEALKAKNVDAQVLHGDLHQGERTRIMKSFKEGGCRVLIATDVAARGIDVESVDAIVNFDPPTSGDFYVHRIGRTARADKEGAAYTLIASDQTAYLQAYQKITGNALVFLPSVGEVDSYTMPRDGSNRMSAIRADSKRFFINIGTRDGMDKESILKLVTGKCKIEVYQIVDVKLRDTYGFIEVNSEVAPEIGKLKGIQIGTRKLNVEEASAKEIAKKPRDLKPYRKKETDGARRPTPRAQRGQRREAEKSGDEQVNARSAKYTDKPYRKERESGEKTRYADKPYAKKDGANKTGYADRGDRKPYADRPRRDAGKAEEGARQTDRAGAKAKTYGAERAGSASRRKAGVARTPDGKILNPKPRGKKIKKL